MAPTSFTVLSPVPRWWAWWIRVTWVVARICPPLVGGLRRLRFIRFARWALAERWPPDPAVRADRAAARCLVFLTTYDGTENQYFNAFVRVVRPNILFAYWGAEGFPKLTFRSIDAYLRAHGEHSGHAFAALPDATMRTTEQALELRRRLEVFECRARGASPERFDREWRAFLADVQGLL
jgi:hypothetical protein